MQLILKRTSAIVLAGALLIVSGCETVGPKAVRAGRTEYNDSLKVTGTEELLLNLVRLRFNDQPYVLGVSNISARVEFAAGVEALVSERSASVSTNVGASAKGILAYAEKPTIVYQPLSGKDFVRQLLTPVDLSTLLLLRGHIRERCD